MKIAIQSLIVLIAFAAFARLAPAAEHTFAVAGSRMLMDGKPFQILSGEMHYSRIPPEYWQDRLRRVKAMGLNTVAIYVFWNVHEPEPGKYDFTGPADVARFVKLAQQEGLYVFLRPGPYCCAEWEFGGFPYWLLNEPDIKIRSRDPKFVNLVRAYDKELGKQLAPLQVTHGGPIIMVQCENEYGSFGKDKQYLGDVKQALGDAGFDVPFCTVDGGPEVVNGSIPGIMAGINGADAADAKKFTDKVHPGGPYMVGEYYPGWLDHWGESFVKVGADSAAEGIDDLASHGVSFNIYMVHGGTNWGFMNGSNDHPFAPSITSYDYDAPISEAGNLTPKYFKVRDVLLKHNPPGSVPTPPANNPAMGFAPVTLGESAAVLANLPVPVTGSDPVTMEALHQAYGYVLYRTTVAKAVNGPLGIERGIRDYAVVMVNGKVVGSLDRRNKKAPPLRLDLPAGAKLELLVENTGRVNYGPTIRDNHQGINGTVSVGDTELHGWESYSLPMTDWSGVPFSAADIASLPAFHRGSFHLDAAADTYVDFRGWGKGQVWINGRNIGRFWGIGPQQALYVPGPWLHAGDNQIVVLEIADTGKRTVGGLDEPILTDLKKPAANTAVPHGG